MAKDTSSLRDYSRLYLEIGFGLIITGCGFILNDLLFTNWLSFLGLGLSLSIFVKLAVVWKNFILFGLNLLAIGIAAGLYIFLFSPSLLSIEVRNGLLILLPGIVFLLLALASLYFNQKIAWWSFLVGWVMVCVSAPFIIGEMTVIGFVFWVLVGAGSGLLIWGVFKRLFGLIIPGSLLSSIGIGIYTAWNNVVTPNGLTETGIMLVWFALGWGAITVISRVYTTRFIWWPLIPGGILAMVGWGLYSGGDPHNALSFIGNTGSIGVLIFGLYLLLMRHGIKS